MKIRKNLTLLKGMIFGLLLFSLYGCSTENKLEELGYSEAEVSQIANEDYAEDIVSNMITKSELDSLKKEKGFDEENLQVYVKLLNKVYTIEELDHVIVVGDLLEEKGNIEDILKGSVEDIKGKIKKYLVPTITLNSTTIDATSSARKPSYLKTMVEANSAFDGKIANGNITVTGDVQTNELGKFKVTFLATDSKGYEAEITETIEVVDTEKPVIIDSQIPNEIYQGDTIDLIEGIKAKDNYDGDITSDIQLDENDFNKDEPGSYKVKYIVEDSNGNVREKNRTIKVKSLSSLGDSIELNKYTLNVKSYRFNRTDSEPQNGVYSYYTADSGQTFLIVSIQIKNLDDIKRQPFDTFGNDQHMIDAELEYNNQYTYQAVAHSLENNWYDYFESKLNPLTTKTMNLTFEIPQEVKESGSLIIHLTSYNAFDGASYRLRD